MTRRLVNPLTFAAAGAVLGISLIAFGVIELLLNRGGPSAPNDQGTWARSAASAATPVFLAQPVISNGEGWSIETRVANLGQLDLVIAAEDAGRLSLVNVYTGEAVAVGTFGSPLFVRLRDNPQQLIVADYDAVASSSDRLLVFDMHEDGFTLANERPLPPISGCEGFCDLMYVMPDGHDAFVLQRSWKDTPECRPGGIGGGNAALCVIDSFSRVDLDSATGFDTVPLPITPECPIPTSSCSFSAPACDVRDLVPSSTGQVVIRCNDKFLFVDARGEMSGPRSLGATPTNGYRNGYPSYGAPLPDGSVRVIMSDGRVRTVLATNDVLEGDELPIAGTVGSISRIDDTHALAAVYVTNSQMGSLALVDLTNVKVVAKMEVPKTAWGFAVLDPNRAVLLLRTDTGVELQQVDLASGKLGGIVPLRGLPGLPSAIVR